MEIRPLQSTLRAVALIGSALLLSSCRNQSPTPSTGTAPITHSIELQSSVFEDGETIPTEYSCSGAGTSPPLSWTGVPPEAKSLALFVTDPDAPGGTWTHWMLWNLPPTTTNLPANIPAQAKLPSGARQGKNSSDSIGYTPPCPPSGKPHRYIFTLYALDDKVDLSGVPVQEYSAKLHEHVLAQGQIMGRFGR